MMGTSPLPSAKACIWSMVREKKRSRARAALATSAIEATNSSARTGSASKGVMPPRMRGEYQARSMARSSGSRPSTLVGK
jgi:hypothetical protein